MLSWLTCLHMEGREAKRRKGLLYGLRRPCLWDNTKTMHIRFSTSLSHSHTLTLTYTLFVVVVVDFFLFCIYIFTTYLLFTFCAIDNCYIPQNKKKKDAIGPFLYPGYPVNEYGIIVVCFWYIVQNIGKNGK